MGCHLLVASAAFDNTQRRQAVAGKIDGLTPIDDGLAKPRLGSEMLSKDKADGFTYPGGEYV